MKTKPVIIFILLAAMLSISCGVTDLVQRVGGGNTITPSDVIITDQRTVSDFTAIDLRSFGKVNLTQGDSVSLTIKGSDNIVPLIHTTVSNGKLIIDMDNNVNVLHVSNKDILTFDITVKDLTDLTISGLGDVQMDTLSTTSFNVTMSGAGNLVLNHLTAESLQVNVSGLGGVEIAGKVTTASFEIPGAGGVKAGDLECQTATVNISGLGGATVWVTGQLTGSISGAGDVSYYGNPQTNTTSSGLGSFKSLGNK
jgi:Putative auto-transporter adhesin, head GIN domain